MAVIPFPIRPQPHPLSEAADQATMLAAALHFLGEPATIDELLGLLLGLSLVPPETTQACVLALLEAYAASGLDRDRDMPVFREVTLRNAPAWAFTVQFRSEMCRTGLKASLRPQV